eukprot:Hpha_TRINITY_DN15950_c1_g14::TRINITY_DN15950_c1_g14_i1::g.70739::m.70739
MFRCIKYGQRGVAETRGLQTAEGTPPVMGTKAMVFIALVGDREGRGEIDLPRHPCLRGDPALLRRLPRLMTLDLIRAVDSGNTGGRGTLGGDCRSVGPNATARPARSLPDPCSVGLSRGGRGDTSSGDSAGPAYESSPWGGGEVGDSEPVQGISGEHGVSRGETSPWGGGVLGGVGVPAKSGEHGVSRGETSPLGGGVLGGVGVPVRSGEHGVSRGETSPLGGGVLGGVGVPVRSGEHGVCRGETSPWGGGVLGGVGVPAKSGEHAKETAGGEARPPSGDSGAPADQGRCRFDFRLGVRSPGVCAPDRGQVNSPSASGGITSLHLLSSLSRRFVVSLQSVFARPSASFLVS